MAGNNSIQLLRGTAAQIAASTEIALDGQPVYDKTNNQLYIGDGTTQIRNLEPVLGATGTTGPTGPTGPIGPFGSAAGFGTVTASVNLVPTTSPSTVQVTTSGSNTSKNFNFVFELATIKVNNLTYSYSDFATQYQDSYLYGEDRSYPTTWRTNSFAFTASENLSSDVLVSIQPTLTYISKTLTESGNIYVTLPSFLPFMNNIYYKINSCTISGGFHNDGGGGTGSIQFTAVLQGRGNDDEGWEDITDTSATIASNSGEGGSRSWSLEYSNNSYKYRNFGLYLSIRSLNNGNDEASISVGSIDLELESIA